MKETVFILASESYLLRKGLAAILSRIPGTRIVREFDNLSQLEDFLRSSSMACLIITETLYDKFQERDALTPELLDRCILLRTGHETKAEGGMEERLFPQAVIHLQDPKEEIIDVLQKVGEEQQVGRTRDPELTPREQTIVRLVSMGMTNKQIAEELFLSAHTVITHRKNISGKLGIKSVSGLTIYAIVNNIVTITELSHKA